MARKRMISPDIWESYSFSKLSILAKLLFIGLFSNADDEGRGKANPAFLKSKLFPYDDSMRVADIEAALGEVAAEMSVTVYSHDGKEYYSLDNWTKWQKVDRPSPSNIPVFDDGCVITRGTFDEHSTNIRRTLDPNRIEDNKNRKEKEQKQNIEPPAVVPQELIDFYQDNISRNFITPRELDNIEFWLDKVDADVILWAMEQAADYKKPTWKYIERILENHFNAGRTTLGAVKAASRSFKNGADKQANVFNDGGQNYDEIEKIIQEKM